MKSLPQLRCMKLGAGLVGLAALAGGLIALNVLIGNLAPLRLDLTEEKLYTLSKGSRQVVGSLDRTVKLMFFFNRSSPEVPVPLKTFADRVEDLLREFERSAGGRIIVESYDPRPDSDAEDLAIEKGISGQPLGLDGPNLYLGLAVVAGDQETVMPAIAPGMEGQLEYSLARLIYQITREEKPVVGVMSGLPVLGMRGQPFALPGQPRPPPQPPWAVFKNLQEDYEVREIPNDTGAIDPDVKVLIAVHPRKCPEKTLYAIDQFILRGGSLLAFLDPACLVQSEYGPQENAFGISMDSASDLDRLLSAWKIRLETGKAVSDPTAKTGVRTASTVTQNPTWLSLRAGTAADAPGHINREDNLTSGLELMLMPVAGAFAGIPDPGLEMTSLLTSSPRARLVDAMMARFGGEAADRDLVGGLQRLNLAVRLHGKFKTAFPEGPPADQKSDAGETAEPADADPGSHLTESEEESAVILVADADMLHDRFCVAQVGALQIFGITAFQPINDNLHFFANAVELLAGDPALISIRARGKTDRPFHRVRELAARAEDKWRAEEGKLQEQLEQTQNELSRLQTEKGTSQRYILSPEQKEAIKRFRQKEADTRKALKEVRRKLREDIERLGLLLKVLNIGVMPLLVCGAGLGYAYYQHRRERT